ncbi:hypothetical protein, partial [Mesorhizobium sp. M4B.F.Ca.ET.013.02.1.1]|uniref:hypothetical protein n=1 Tax=Mesorhizobium sp. M4B.F.Ca.ET.013.02.1.1 TaxID=2496755 RepID=UPI001678A2DD
QCVDILALLRRYEEGAWRLHDSKLTAMPTRYGGTAFEEAFRILSIGLAIPQLRRLADILGEVSP